MSSRQETPLRPTLFDRVQKRARKFLVNFMSNEQERGREELARMLIGGAITGQLPQPDRQISYRKKEKQYIKHADGEKHPPHLPTTPKTVDTEEKRQLRTWKRTPAQAKSQRPRHYEKEAQIRPDSKQGERCKHRKHRDRILPLAEQIAHTLEAETGTRELVDEIFHRATKPSGDDSVQGDFLQFAAR
ncbi:hypothetical protein MMC18_004317 [Xylographa bjoerkii]|nr:hypothetical protein [Xylographa bjoerkii]